MGARVEGKVNLLSGHYQDIIISENRQGNFQIKARPDELFSVERLDDTYSHFDYGNFSDLDKVRSIVDLYLNNNTIFMLSNYGKLKNYSGHFQSVNAYNTLIDGYASVSKALYFRIVNKELFDVINKIISKYNEDRIRHLDKILSSREIIIGTNLHTTSYYNMKDDKTYILLKCFFKDRKNHDYDIDIHEYEKIFLKKLLIEFIGRNGYKFRCIGSIIEVWSSDYKKVITLDEELKPYIMDVINEVDRLNKGYNNITIDEYLSQLDDKMKQKKKIR